MPMIGDEEFERRFDEGEDITAFIDHSSARRPNMDRVDGRQSPGRHQGLAHGTSGLGGGARGPKAGGGVGQNGDFADERQERINAQYEEMNERGRGRVVDSVEDTHANPANLKSEAEVHIERSA